MLIYATLTCKSLVEVATEELSMLATRPNSTAGKAWNHKNAKACAEMIPAVETDQLAYMSAKTATKFWTELEHVYCA